MMIAISCACRFDKALHCAVIGALWAELSTARLDHFSARTHDIGTGVARILIAAASDLSAFGASLSRLGVAHQSAALELGAVGGGAD